MASEGIRLNHLLWFLPPWRRRSSLVLLLVDANVTLRMRLVVEDATACLRLRLLEVCVCVCRTRVESFYI